MQIDQTARNDYPQMSSQVRALAAAARLIVFDVDGVLTDGRIAMLADGQEQKIFHSRDGLGIKLLLDNGIEVAVISGRRSTLVDARMRALGVAHVFQGNDLKLPIFERLLQSLGIEPAHSIYVGDDLIDLPVMARAGLAIAVADAHPAVRARADWQTVSPGGHGAGRECCDLVLSAKGLLEAIVEGYHQGALPRQPSPSGERTAESRIQRSPVQRSEP